jgi:protein SCO1/2
MDQVLRLKELPDAVTYPPPVLGPTRRAATCGIGAAVMAVALAACGGGSGPPTSKPVGATAAQEGVLLHGAVLRPPNTEPTIRLTDTAGKRYDVAARNRGKVTLVYFGYTHCPDVCPTTMADIAAALRRSSSAVRRDVTVVFVTVDPHRDSLAVVRQWLNGFSHRFVGLRGSLSTVIADQRAAGLPASRVSKNGKAVEHSAQIIAYTPDRMEHVFYTEGPSTISDLRHDLPILVHDRGYA